MRRNRVRPRRRADFPGANLGLYSITFVNDLEQDREALLGSRNFARKPSGRISAISWKSSIRTSTSGIAPEKLGEFINDNILRTLAGVPESGRPVFLKIVYHGPQAMEELAQYDPNLVVGILGGSAGTTYDAFKLIHDAQKYGARVALFGRKINNAEHQLAFIEMLRLITDGKLSPEEAVRAYHGVLQAKASSRTARWKRISKLTDQAMSYDGSATRRSTVRCRTTRWRPPGSARRTNGIKDTSLQLHREMATGQSLPMADRLRRNELRAAPRLRPVAADGALRLAVNPTSETGPRRPRPGQRGV